MTRLPLITLAGLLLAGLASPATGQDPNATYTIKFHKEQAGDKTTITKVDRKRVQIEANVNGMEIKKDEVETEDFAYTQTVIETPGPGRKPTKLVRDYTKAELGKSGNVRPLSFAGKTVLIEKGAGGYKFQIKGGAELTGAEAAPLQREFRKEVTDDEKYLPKGPVKLNQVWTIDLKALTADEGDKLPFDLARSTGTGKLTKVYQKDGRQFGVIELNMAMVMTGEAEGTLKFAGTIDACIDGSVNEGKMTMRAGGMLTLKIPNAGSAKMNLEMAGEETRKPVK